MLAIAGYFLVSIAVYCVLMKLVEKKAWSSTMAERVVVIVALIWPFWGECALLVIVGYVVVKGLGQLRQTCGPKMDL